MTIPADFEPLFRTSPALDLIGPLYSRGERENLVIGLRAEAKQCNARGTVHGGILATLADVALGYTMAFSSDPSAALVTANLSLDFAGTAKAGGLAGGPRRHSEARESRFVRIVRASAVFLVAGQLDAAART